MMLDAIAPTSSGFQSTSNGQGRASAPEHGRSLFATVSQVGNPIRQAARSLIKGSSHTYRDVNEILEPVEFHPPFGGIKEKPNCRAAWALLNISILYTVWTSGRALPDFQKATKWFFGNEKRLAIKLLQGFTSKQIFAAQQLLKSVIVDEDFIDLLPYILEPHDPASRLTVARDPRTAAARKEKRRGGVFYTPTDVANYLVGKAAGNNVDGLWLDPACGTGVFLRAIFEGPAKRDLSRVRGIDISTLSIESCTFGLMVAAVKDLDSKVVPYQHWLRLRYNLAVGDAMSLIAPTHNEKDFLAKQLIPLMKNRLASKRKKARVQFGNQIDFSSDKQRLLNEIFTDCARGFEHIVINPPYSTVPCTRAMSNNWQSFKQLSEGERAKVHLAFVEMMWRFGRPGMSRAAAVLPLAVACGQDKQSKNCRAALSQSGGHWAWHFFDRQPHALFGEDVKTRNTILLRDGEGEQTTMHTSRLRKWTSKNRKSIFSGQRTTEISPSLIQSFVPKVGGQIEFQVYSQLLAHRETAPLAELRGTMPLASVAKDANPSTLYVATTAYNFLNAFRDLPPKNEISKPYSESPAIALRSKSAIHAYAAYAVLASRISFWIWHVEGDGFHVTQTFIDNLPLLRLPFSQPQLRELASLGRELWSDAKKGRVSSVNGGRVTLSHAPSATSPQLHRAEQIILSSAAISSTFLSTLDEFTASTVAIDGTNRRRNNVDFSHDIGVPTL